MKKAAFIILLLIPTIFLSGCDLNPVVNFLRGNYKNTSSETPYTTLKDGSLLFYEGTVSKTAKIEMRDESGKVWLENGDIIKVSAMFDEISAYHILLEFTEEGGKKLEEATNENLNKSLSIFADGEMIHSAVIREPIKGVQVCLGVPEEEGLFDLFKKLTE